MKFKEDRPRWSIIFILLAYLLICMVLMQCSPKSYTQTSEEETEKLKVVGVDKVKGEELLDVGDTLEIPSIGVRLVKISPFEMEVITPVELIRETKLIPTKTVNKNRVSNRIVQKDKSDHSVRTKEVEKKKTVSRSVKKSGLTWLFIVLLLLGILYFIGRKFAPKWLSLLFP